MSLFARQDWTLFRSLETLGQKAGVPLRSLGALVIKELVDNALDAGAIVTAEEGMNGWVTIVDNGPGIPEHLVTSLFSINRPLTSSKIVRLPQRGALGNGLRVVMGAIYASDGSIMVETGGKSFDLSPRDDGHTDATIGTSTVTRGTKISIRLGDKIPTDKVPLMTYANMALKFAEIGTHYEGKTSPWWYDAASFFEMLHAAGDRPITEIIEVFKGISNGKSYWGGVPRPCNVFTREEASELLENLRKVSKEQKPTVLGSIGELAYNHRAQMNGVLEVGADMPAQLPYVVEVFVKPKEQGDQDTVVVMVNRTRIAGHISASRNKPTRLSMHGCGIHHWFEVPKMPVQVIINITCPYIPITTDGKEPDLERFVGPLYQCLKKAGNKAKAYAKLFSPSNATKNQKDFIRDCLPQAIAKVSHNSADPSKPLPYSLRNLYYAVRPYLEGHFDKELDYNYFCTVITGVELEQGYDMVGMYRDPRGKILHPHTGEEIALGTIAVQNYKRPEWTFNKILYIEKGTPFPLLQAVKWPERHDCALMTSQGFASRAVRDVIDLLGEGEEDIYFFCIHDADASGTMIYQSLVEETKARGKRRVHIVNLGLEPEEGRDMGLQVENFREEGGRKLAVADYLDYVDQIWLQTNRIELNAMTSEEFLKWLDEKFEDYVGKIVPPQEVMEKTWRADAEAAIREAMVEKILAENNLEGRVAEVTKRIEIPSDLKGIVEEGIEDDPTLLWKAPIREDAASAGRELVSAE